MLSKALWTLYSFLVLLLISISVVLWFIPLATLKVLGLAHSRLKVLLVRAWNRLVLSFFFVKLEVEGQENYAPQKSCIIISNHQSLLDIPVVFKVCSGPVTMLAKVELFRIPVFGWALKAAGLIPVNRNSSEAASITYSLMRKRIQQGAQIWLAPEGTRSRDGQLGPFKSGAFRMSVELNLPIICLVVEGAWRALPKGQLRLNPFQKIKVRVLKPITMTEVGARDYREFQTIVWNTMSQTLIDLQKTP